jgi:DNA modification methylase
MRIESKSNTLQVNSVTCGDALDLIPTLADRSVQLVFFSPPFPSRNHGLQCPPESEFPAWIASVFAALRPKLTDDGSVIMELGAHTHDGRMSTYVYETILAIVRAGWILKLDLPWIRPDAPALRDKNLPRQCSSRVLWFSLTNGPYIDLYANGSFSAAIGPTHDPTEERKKRKPTTGISRIPDYFVSFVSEMVKQGHPTPFPISFPEAIIRTFSKPGDLCIDPFCGAGWTLVAAKRLNRRCWGCDVEAKYVALTRRNLGDDKTPLRLLRQFQRRGSLALYLRHVKGIRNPGIKMVKLIREKTIDAIHPARFAQMSLTEFQKRTGLSRPTVIAWLDRLAENECIERIQVPDPHRRQPSKVGLHRAFFESQGDDKW